MGQPSTYLTGSRHKFMTDSPNPNRTPARSSGKTPSYRRESFSDDSDRHMSKKSKSLESPRKAAKSPRSETPTPSNRQCPVKGCDSSGKSSTTHNFMMSQVLM